MKLPDSYYNTVSLVGSMLAALCVTLIVFFQALVSLFGVGSSYIGLFIYIVLPVFLIIGLIIIPLGMLRTVRKKKHKGEPEYVKGIRLDFNNRRHRNAAVIFVFGTVIFLFLTGFGSYEAFHYSESNEFCGTVCHKVMEPEYTAYQDSPHSRVSCVDCHVGEGADWYVKSKLSGLYQVYAVITKSYPVPIPTPIENLRPAQETCERCHWPNKFYSYRLRNEKHFLADENNTEWNIQLKMKIGSEHSAQGLDEGIHWHINTNVKVDYISTSRNRQILPWVRYINTETGDTVIYNDIYDPLDQAAIDTLEVRTMDCIDCHNRPTHNYFPPQEFVDISIASGDIPSKLPEIKRLAMQVLNYSFEDPDTALMTIDTEISNYYSENYPGIFGDQKEMIDKAIEGIKSGFSGNIFPRMQASWDVYPNHVGHIEFNGCFRCHNGNHINDEGEVISRDCDLCHTILAQGTKENMKVTTINESLEFKHPVDVGEVWKEYACSECHRYLY